MDSQQAKIIIKKIMSAANIQTQKKLAEVLGISQPTITKTIKEGRVPDRWIEVISEKFDLEKSLLIPTKQVDISELAYLEAGLEQNKPPNTQAEDQRYGYTIPPQQLRSDITSRLAPIIEWIADETEGNPVELDEFMRSFMKKFEDDNQIYRNWRNGMLAKKQEWCANKDTVPKKANGI